MRCVITNDDGYDAPGLRALYRALRSFADVVVVAPNAECSGIGHGAPYGGPIDVETRLDAEMGEIFVVHGRPADCARLALAELVSPVPDVLISGINRGGNVGVDVYYSGTVAAAREAAILGCTGIAISQFVRRGLPDDWRVSMERAAGILKRLLERRRSDGRVPLWNVNLPHLPAGEKPKGVIQVPAADAPTHMRYQRVAGAKTEHAYQFTGEFTSRPAPPGTDVACLFDGWATITALDIDTSSAVAEIGALDWPID
jgi:5'-nucleotidase